MHKPTKIKKTLRGAAMGAVLLASIAVLSISASLLFFLDASIQQAVNQERDIKAFYASESGINIGVAALLTPVRVTPGDPTSDQTLYSSYKNSGYRTRLTQTLDLDSANPGQTTVDLEIGLYVDPADPSAPPQWIEIKATGKTAYRDRVYEKLSVLLVSLDDPAITKRS